MSKSDGLPLSNAMVTGIFSNGQIEIASQGNRQSIGVPFGIPMTHETIFDVASLTKSVFTANTYMFLSDLGSINLGDPVRRFLPKWNTSEKGEITIEHLLSHRSGLEGWRPLYISCNDKDEALDKIIKLPLVSKVDDKRIYSDLGYIVLGQIIEYIFQSNFETVLEQQLKPILGLENTSFANPKNHENVAATSVGDNLEFSMVMNRSPFEVPERVEDFKRWRTNVLVGEVNDGNAFHIFDGRSSHAGLFSNLQDLLKMCELYLSCLKDSSVFKSTTIRKFVEPGKDQIQGLGFRNWIIKKHARDIRIYGHTGFTGVALGFAPDQDFAAVMLTNRLHTLLEPRKTEDMWLEFLEKSL